MRPQTPTTAIENAFFFVRQLPCDHVTLCTSLITTTAAGESSIPTTDVQSNPYSWIAKITICICPGVAYHFARGKTANTLVCPNGVPYSKFRSILMRFPVHNRLTLRVETEFGLKCSDRVGQLR